MSKTTYSAALAYAHRGWRVFPVRNKRPLVKDWPNQASLDPYQIAHWWQQYPDADVAIATGPGSNLLVVDIDVKNGVNGLESWNDLLPEEGVHTAHVRTASGGHHVYFSTDKEYHNSAGALGPGLDVRCWHGFVVAPPSEGYEWITEPGIIPSVPKWLAEKLTGARAGTEPGGERSKLSELLETPPGVGGRNQWLAQVAGHYANMFPYRDQYDVHIALANNTLKDPLDSSEAQAVAESIWNIARTGSDNPSQENFTDAGNGRRYVAQHKEIARYVPKLQAWLIWDGMRWEEDASLHTLALAHATARAISAEDEGKPTQSWAKQSESVGRLKAMVDLARSDATIQTAAKDLDRHPEWFNVSNGTLNLRTGTLQSHNREDWLTKISLVEYDADAKCPQWENFLLWTMEGDPELVAFLQRAIGYTLTGYTGERSVFILHGEGRNGKSTLLNVVYELLGEYAWKTRSEVLMQQRNVSTGANNDVADMRGRRFIASSETPEGQKLNTALVKDLTGGETISARKLYKETFNFEPEFKLWFSTNHMPNADSTDEAIWDRLRLIPFLARVSDDEVDVALKDTLLAELPGILAWSIRGAIDWFANGLKPPEKVLLATAEYRADQDNVTRFIEEKCERVYDAKTRPSDLYEAYAGWCTLHNERYPFGPKKFSQRLRTLGFARDRLGNSTAILGLKLKAVNF